MGAPGSAFTEMFERIQAEPASPEELQAAGDFIQRSASQANPSPFPSILSEQCVNRLRGSEFGDQIKTPSNSQALKQRKLRPSPPPQKGVGIPPPRQSIIC